MRQVLSFLPLCLIAAVAAGQYPETPPAAPGGDPVVVNEAGDEQTVDTAALRELKRHKLRAVGHDKQQAEFEGVLLADVLRRGGVTLGEPLRGKLMANYLVVEAADGYRVVFSLQELDPASSDRAVLLANRRNGLPLDDRHGKYQLVVPGEKRHSRWVRGVTKLRVLTAK